MNTKELLEKINKIGDTENLFLDELRQKVGYLGSIDCFRVVCWRNKIPYARGYRGRNPVLEKLKAEGYDFYNSSLLEIKKALGYKGGLDGLTGLLKKHGIEYRKFDGYYPQNHKAVLARVKKLGDTSVMRPKQILAKIGIEIQNPAQFLTRLNVPYKRKRTKAV